MKAYDISDYVAAGCTFATTGKSPDVFAAVHALTGYKVCDTGCAWFDGGKCSAYRKLTSIHQAPAAQQVQEETVRETAKRLGISISEVRRRRRGSAT